MRGGVARNSPSKRLMEETAEVWPSRNSGKGSVLRDLDSPQCRNSHRRNTQILLPS